MVRELKFRYIFKYIGSNELRIFERTLEQIQNHNIYDEFRFSGDSPINWEQIAVVQYIGKADKNGKEIYEGDILNIPSTGYDVKEYNHKVIWNEDNLTYEGITKSGRVYQLWLNLLDVEVIGNIYENPELIE